MIYKGSCHCGQVAYEVEGDLQGVMECNCSICSRKGAKMWFVPLDKLKLLTDERNSASYLFNKHLEGVDFESLPVKHFDGRSL
jgi:hypothetical protein